MFTCQQNYVVFRVLFFVAAACATSYISTVKEGEIVIASFASRLRDLSLPVMFVAQTRAVI